MKSESTRLERKQFTFVTKHTPHTPRTCGVEGIDEKSKEMHRHSKRFYVVATHLII